MRDVRLRDVRVRDVRVRDGRVRVLFVWLSSHLFGSRSSPRLSSADS